MGKKTIERDWKMNFCDFSTYFFILYTLVYLIVLSLWFPFPYFKLKKGAQVNRYPSHINLTHILVRLLKIYNIVCIILVIISFPLRREFLCDIIFYIIFLLWIIILLWIISLKKIKLNRNIVKDVQFVILKFKWLIKWTT